jgi:hypothetical protein
MDDNTQCEPGWYYDGFQYDMYWDGGEWTKQRPHGGYGHMGRAQYSRLLPHQKFVIWATIAFVLACGLYGFLAASANADPRHISTAPILGPKADPYYRYGMTGNEDGFWTVKPDRIYLGGDYSGIVCHIRWKTWGGPVAHGVGNGFYLGPNQFTYQGHFTRVNVTASHLGWFKGNRAYNKVTWSSPSHGRVHAAACRA